MRVGFEAVLGHAAPVRVGPYARLFTRDSQALSQQMAAMIEHLALRGRAIGVEIEDIGSGPPRAAP
jgi:hypothetical protein